MKKFLTILLLAPVLAFAQGKMPKNSATYDAQIISVTDGDTIVIAAPFLPQPLKPQLAVRVFGVDTPEKGHRAQCPQEAQRGEQATAFTKDAVARASSAKSLCTVGTSLVAVCWATLCWTAAACDRC
jgi:endonuclease YncB( thermonuclease family)